MSDLQVRRMRNSPPVPITIMTDRTHLRGLNTKPSMSYNIYIYWVYKFFIHGHRFKLKGGGVPQKSGWQLLPFIAVLLTNFLKLHRGLGVGWGYTPTLPPCMGLRKEEIE
jgi:hypothetical protein